MADLSAQSSVSVFPFPFFPGTSYFGSAIRTISTMNTSDRKFSPCGRVVWADGATHTVKKVGFYPNVSIQGTSTLKCALQDVSLTSGPPEVGDGTDDDSGTLAVPAAGRSYLEFTLGGTKSVANGGLLAVEVSYSDYGGFSSIVWEGHDRGGDYGTFTSSCNYYQGGGWAASNYIPIIVLVSDDASPVYGTIEAFTPFISINAHTYNSGSNPKVYACEFTPENDTEICGLWAYLYVSNAAANFDLVLYDSGGSVLASVSTDANALALGGTGLYSVPLSARVTLTGGEVYRVGVRPTTTNSLTAYSLNVSAAEHMAAAPGGTAWTYSTLSSGDAWAAPTATRRFLAGVVVAGVGGSGGGRRTHARFHGV